MVSFVDYGGDCFYVFTCVAYIMYSDYLNLLYVWEKNQNKKQN